MSEIAYPHLRALLLGYLEMLADPVDLPSTWGRAGAPASLHETEDDLYEILSPTLTRRTAPLNVAQSVGEVIHRDELESLDRMLTTWDEIWHQRDARLLEVEQARWTLDHPEWPKVIEAARAALERMRRNDAGAPT